MMEKRVRIFLEEHHMIEKGDHVIAGISGGADSVCLLLVLKKLLGQIGFSLSAVHVEHGIRGEESLRDEEFVKEFCKREQIRLSVCRVDAKKLSAESNCSLEEAARILRYRCFLEEARRQGAKKIAVAHHGDDCAETVLFHLSRGTGLRGLCGITPIREIDPTVFGAENGGERISLIRPLLCVTRAEVERYLNGCGQAYRIDSTNGDIAYARNRIREKILPEMRTINERAVQHMVRTAGYMEEVCDFLDAAAWEQGRAGVQCSYEGERLCGVRLQTEQFDRLHSVLRDNLIHQLLGMLAGSKKDITDGHVRSVRELFGARVGKSVSLPYGMEAAKTYQSVILRFADKADDAGQEPVPLIPGETVVAGGLRICAKVRCFDGDLQKIPGKTYTKWLNYDKMSSNVLLRTRRAGDYLQVGETGGTKKLKDYLIDEKVEREKRDQILLLAQGSHVIWVVGYRISEAYKVTRQTKRVLEVRVCKGE